MTTLRFDGPGREPLIAPGVIAYSPHRAIVWQANRRFVGPNEDPGSPLYRLFVLSKLFRILLCYDLILTVPII